MASCVGPAGFGIVLNPDNRPRRASERTPPVQTATPVLLVPDRRMAEPGSGLLEHAFMRHRTLGLT